MPALPGYNCFWTRSACETVVLFVDVGFCEKFAVLRYLEAASLQIISLYTRNTNPEILP